jgi:hypothetical protein
MVLASTAVACDRFASEASSVDAGTEDASTSDADVYAGTVTREDKFDGPGVRCPEVGGNFVTLEQTGGGRSGGACLICNEQDHQDTLVFGASIAAAPGTYTAYSYVRAAAGLPAPESRPTFLLNGSVADQGNTWTPDDSWHRVAYSITVEGGVLSWGITGHSTAPKACFLVDDVTVVRE